MLEELYGFSGSGLFGYSHMVKWIQHPQAVDPKNVMPELGITDQEARDISAYLYTLR